MKLQSQCGYTISDFLTRVIRNEYGKKRKSNYYACLVDARKAANRNVRTGEPKKEKQGNWLGVCGYLMLIEVIGNLWFKTIDKNGATLSRQTFVKGLKSLSKLREEECHALYWLRCSFFHNYGLYMNEGQPKYFHHFVLFGSGLQTIKLPKTTWNGKTDTFTIQSTTAVNVQWVEDLVEGIHKRLVEEARNGDLKLPEGYSQRLIEFF